MAKNIDLSINLDINKATKSLNDFTDRLKNLGKESNPTGINKFLQFGQAVSGSAKELLSAAGPYAAAAGVLVAGVSKVVSTLNEWAGAYREVEKIQTNLNVIMGSMGPIVGKTSDDINNMAGNLSKALNIDDDELVSGMTKLASFGTITKDNFDKATESMTDMMAYTGKGADEVSQTLGVALSDPAGKGVAALKEYGIVLTKNQKEYLASLSKEEAQRYILNNIQEKMGNMAEEQADTAEGRLNGLKVATDNMKESVGSVWSAMTDVFVKSILPIVQKVSEWIGENIGSIKTFGVVVSNILLGVGKVIINGILAPFRVVIDSIELGSKFFEILFSNAINGFNSLSIVLSKVGELMSYVFTGRWDKIPGAVSGIKSEVTNFSKSLGSILVNGLKEPLKKVWDDGTKVFTNISNTFGDIADTIYGNDNKTDKGKTNNNNNNNNNNDEVELGNKTISKLIPYKDMETRKLSPEDTKILNAIYNNIMGNPVDTNRKSYFDNIPSNEEINRLDSNEKLQVGFVDGVDTITPTIDNMNKGFEKTKELLSPITEGIKGLIDGTKTLKDIWSDFLGNLTSMLIDMAANALIMGVFSLITGTPMSALGGFGAIFGFAEGGAVTGGVSGVDSVPALLMPGEFVMNRNAVNRIGMNELNNINNGLSSGNTGNITINQNIGSIMGNINDAIDMEKRTLQRARKEVSQLTRG